MHVKKVIDSGRTKLNQLHSAISNRSINMSARRMLLLAVVRPSVEYGKVWECNKGQANALECIIVGGAKKILGCSSRTCNEAVRGNMGIDTLRSRRDKAKLKWWYKLASMPENRYPKQLFSQEWNIKPRRGRQRKTWGRVVNDLFVALGIDIYKCTCTLPIILHVLCAPLLYTCTTIIVQPGMLLRKYMN